MGCLDRLSNKQMDVSRFGLTFFGFRSRDPSLRWWCGARWHKFTPHSMADVSLRSVITGPSAQFQHIHPPKFGMIGGDSSTSSTIFSRRGWFTGNPYLINICCYDLHKEKNRKIFCGFSLQHSSQRHPKETLLRHKSYAFALAANDGAPPGHTAVYGNATSTPG